MKLSKAETFKTVTDAYSTLSDEESRKIYDENQGLYEKVAYQRGKTSQRKSEIKVDRPWKESGYGSGGGVGRDPKWRHQVWYDKHYGEESVFHMDSYTQGKFVPGNRGPGGWGGGGGGGKPPSRHATYAMKRQKKFLMEEVRPPFVYTHASGYMSTLHLHLFHCIISVIYALSSRDLSHDGIILAPYRQLI